MYGATRKRVTSELSTKDRPKRKKKELYIPSKWFIRCLRRQIRTSCFFLFWFCVLSSVRIYKPNEIACKYVFVFVFFKFRFIHFYTLFHSNAAGGERPAWFSTASFKKHRRRLDSVADCCRLFSMEKRNRITFQRGWAPRSLSSSFFCGLREFGINLIKQIKGKIFLINKKRNTTNKIGTIHRQYNKRNCLATGNTYRIGFFFFYLVCG